MPQRFAEATATRVQRLAPAIDGVTPARKEELKVAGRQAALFSPGSGRSGTSRR